MNAAQQAHTRLATKTYCALIGKELDELRRFLSITVLVRCLRTRSLRAVLDAACRGMAVTTPDPRVNFSLLERFVGQRVCLVGRVSILQLSTQQPGHL